MALLVDRAAEKGGEPLRFKEAIQGTLDKGGSLSERGRQRLTLACGRPV